MDLIQPPSDLQQILVVWTRSNTFRDPVTCKWIWHIDRTISYLLTFTLRTNLMLKINLLCSSTFLIRKDIKKIMLSKAVWAVILQVVFETEFCRLLIYFSLLSKGKAINRWCFKVVMTFCGKLWYIFSSYLFMLIIKKQTF